MILRHRSLSRVVIATSILFVLPTCDDSPTGANSDFDPALNGAWVSDVQTGAVKVYITELRFNNGSFEWTFDDDLQQRGAYDTRDGILTVTVHNNYGSPQRYLGDYSRPYSISRDTLRWGGSDFSKK